MSREPLSRERIAELWTGRGNVMRPTEFRTLLAAAERVAALEGLLRRADGALTELLRPCLVCEGPKGAITNAQCNCNEARTEGFATLAALRAENGEDE